MPKRIIFPAKGKVELVEFEPPALGADELLIRTDYSLMSIGTESIILHRKYDPETHFARMFSFPQLKTGVQALGRVIRTGREVSEFTCGDRVYMREAHGSHQVVAAAHCTKVPESLAPGQACWAGLAKTAFRAAWAAGFNESQHVLVIGAGPVGQMVLRWARVGGVSELAVSDLSTARLEHARRGGAGQVFAGGLAENIETIQMMNDGQGPDIVVDSTGNAAVFQEALAVAGKFARVILVGDSGYPSKQCLSSHAMQKGLTIQATHDSHDRDGWNQRKVDAHFFSLVAAGRFNLDGLITHEYRPDQCVEAYQQANERRNETLGVLFDWTGDY